MIGTRRESLYKDIVRGERINYISDNSNAGVVYVDPRGGRRRVGTVLSSARRGLVPHDGDLSVLSHS